MSLKRFRIEQLCPSIDSNDFTCFCTLPHYVIVNLKVKITCSMCTAKRMIPRRSHSTQFESFIIVSTKTGKKSLKINVKRHSKSA